MTDAIGFIGLGVMGEPICRNLLRKSGRKVLAFDLAAEPLARIVAGGAVAAKSVADVVGELAAQRVRQRLGQRLALAADLRGPLPRRQLAHLVECRCRLRRGAGAFALLPRHPS